MTRRFFTLRSLILFLFGILLLLCGVLAVWVGKIPTSFAEARSLIYAGRDSSAQANACLMSEDNNQVYFVSCGGFF